MWTGLLAVGLLATLAPSTGENVRLVQNYPVVNAFVNGHGPFRMVVDTGATTCSLHPRIAARAGIKADYRIALETFSETKIVFATRHTLVRVGEHSVSGVEFIVHPSNALRKLEPGIVGVLGQSFLNVAPWLLDFRSRRLYLGAEAEQMAETLPPGIAFEWISGRIALPAAFPGKLELWKLILDSGTSSMILSCSTECPNLLGLGPARINTTLGATEARSGVLSSINVAGKTIRSAETVLVSVAGARGAAGLLPASWFSALYVDNARQLIRMRER